MRPKSDFSNASAYLVGLIGHSCPSSAVAATHDVPGHPTAAPPLSTTVEDDVPAGWQRVVSGACDSCSRHQAATRAFAARGECAALP